MVSVEQFANIKAGDKLLVENGLKSIPSTRARLLWIQ